MRQFILTVARRLRAVATVAALAGVALLATAPAAQAQDFGGVGNPAVDCPNGYTVTSADIHDHNGFTIGRVDLRWAYSCGGNWARTTSYVGNVSQIESRVAPSTWLSGPGSAYSIDYNVNQNWSYYLNLSPTALACVKGSLFYNGAWNDATICSH